MSSVGAVESFAAAMKGTGTNVQCEDLVKLYPPLSSFSESKSIDLEKCKFFDLFDTDPAEARAIMEKKRKDAEAEHGAAFMWEISNSRKHHPLKQNRRYDLRLKPEEKERLAATGVIACERFMYRSFGNIYYNLYSDDLPVFVTSDSILHAWHRSYDAFVVDLEEKCLCPTLRTILESSLYVCEEMTTNSTEKQSERVKKAANDVSNYLAMGLSLLRGRAKRGYENLETLRYTVLQEQNTEVELFSTRRNVDFSLFKPRGHYTTSESLENYFRAMMWIGIVNLHMDDLHQLLCGVILLHYLRESKMFDCVQQFDSLLSSLVGSGADSLSMRDFTKFISPATMAKLIDPSASSDRERLKLLQSLQQRIIEKSPVSQIGTSFESSAEQEGECLVSLALFGQRFVWSAFVFSRLVGSEVLHEGVMQPRRVPSAVDIAFTLFGNNEAGQELVNRMEMSPDADGFVPHRDGIPISSNLVALRKVIDEEFTKESAATASVSILWLLALRALSLPSPNRSSTFHNGTWQRRQMNTQIASFTQLRHDTVLYAQQSSLRKPMCEFPDGMVDPYPEFWRRMREMALRMNDIEDDAQTLRDFHSKSNFDEFASTMKTLEDISVLQTSGKKLNEDQVTFMQSIIEKHFGSGSPTYTGWYPSLFYGEKRKSCTRDVLVVDVHTDYIDSGHVLHLGVGDPVIGFFIVNEVMYAGPLFSSYEFTTPLGQRMTDEEFEEEMPWIETPEWALQSFLCRGEYGESPDVDGNESMDT